MTLIRDDSGQASNDFRITFIPSDDLSTKLVNLEVTVSYKIVKNDQNPDEEDEGPASFITKTMTSQSPYGSGLVYFSYGELELNVGDEVMYFFNYRDDAKEPAVHTVVTSFSPDEILETELDAKIRPLSLELAGDYNIHRVELRVSEEIGDQMKYPRVLYRVNKGETFNPEDLLKLDDDDSAAVEGSTVYAFTGVQLNNGDTMDYFFTYYLPANSTSPLVTAVINDAAGDGDSRLVDVGEKDLAYVYSEVFTVTVAEPREGVDFISELLPFDPDGKYDNFYQMYFGLIDWGDLDSSRDPDSGGSEGGGGDDGEEPSDWHFPYWADTDKQDGAELRLFYKANQADHFTGQPMTYDKNLEKYVFKGIQLNDGDEFEYFFTYLAYPNAETSVTSQLQEMVIGDDDADESSAVTDDYVTDAYLNEKGDGYSFAFILPLAHNITQVSLNYREVASSLSPEEELTVNRNEFESVDMRMVNPVFFVKEDIAFDPLGRKDMLYFFRFTKTSPQGDSKEEEETIVYRLIESEAAMLRGPNEDTISSSLVILVLVVLLIMAVGVACAFYRCKHRAEHQQLRQRDPDQMSLNAENSGNYGDVEVDTLPEPPVGMRGGDQQLHVLARFDTPNSKSAESDSESSGDEDGRSRSRSRSVRMHSIEIHQGTKGASDFESVGSIRPPPSE